MSTLSVSEWKSFLKARILQEEGQDEKALTVFEELLSAHPDDPHLQSSRAFALERLGRPEEARANRVAVKYADLGKTLIGPADKPEAWIGQLSNLLNATEEAELKGAVASSVVAW
jgi:predicted Zn-dependent protease